jgi:hypothetical protein
MADDLIQRIKNHVSAIAPPAGIEIASDEAIAAAESALGFTLPALLTACYREIGNGGFGPNNGIIGVEGGHASDYGDLVATYRLLADDFERGGWEATLLPFCGWGCATLSCVMCDTTLRICTFEEGEIWPQRYTLDGFFEMWLNGTDILANDPDVFFEDKEFRNPFTGTRQIMRVPRRRRK